MTYGTPTGANMFAYCMNNPVMGVDYAGLWTLSFGYNLAGSPSIWSFNHSGCLTIDSYLNVVPQSTFAGGVTTGTPSASIVFLVTITNAPSYDKLNGQGFQVGGSVAAPVYGIPFAVSGEMNIIPDDINNTSYYGGTAGIGFGVPGVEGHIEWGETRSNENERINLKSVARDVYNRAERWFNEIF